MSAEEVLLLPILVTGLGSAAVPRDGLERRRVAATAAGLRLTGTVPSTGTAGNRELTIGQRTT